jgi:hypothetical protein
MLIGDQMRQIEYPFLTFDIIAETGADTFNLRIYGSGTNVYWGDGNVSFCGGDTPDVSHTFAPGAYTVSIEKAYRVGGFTISGSTCNIVRSNEAWQALPDLGTIQISSCANSQLELTTLPEPLREVTLNYSFQHSSSAMLPLKKIPSNAVQLLHTFDGCRRATLPFTELQAGLRGNNDAMFYDCQDAVFTISYLPEGITSLAQAFQHCAKATISFDRLPPGITSLYGTFQGCEKLTVNLNDLADNAPDGGYTELTNMSVAFNGCPGVTGSRSKFLAACPNIQNTDYAFNGTNTTE